MDVLLVAVRAVHFGASIVVFGEVVFALLATDRSVETEVTFAAHGRRIRVAAGAWIVAAISAVGWLVLVSARMSGQPLDASFEAATVATVLEATTFGRAWSVQAVLALALAALWPVLHAEPLPWRRRAWVGAAALSGASLAGLAWAGHANADVGLDGIAHHAGDAIHLVAAGAWLGGLAPLAALLGRLGCAPTTRGVDDCARIATRFGNWAALCVCVLLLTGIANAYYLLRTSQASIETTYGKLLLVKLLLFALMLAVAASNRTRLTKALRATEVGTMRRIETAGQLRRNVRVELALGTGVIVLVAALGVTQPPA